jgi:CubicO group peptidase (beta-lactamase class C family)
MFNRRELVVAGLGVTLVPTFARASASDDRIRALLEHRVDGTKTSVGMAACILSGDNQQFAACGRQRADEKRPVSLGTVFEIGSITKVFTALLLADLARHGKLAIDDPAAKHLPQDFRLPQKDGRQITLADLATHTSGLPRFPAMTPKPYEAYPSPAAFFEALAAAIKTYRLSDMKAWLAQFVLPRAPGSSWEYSNMGYAILGLALSHRSGLSYEELVQRRILDRIGLAETFVATREPGSYRLAGSHDQKLNLVPATDSGIFGPAGSIRSTIRDLAHFMRSVMPNSGSPVEASAQLLLQTQRPAPLAGGKQALGWEILQAKEGDYVSKDGVTNGQCATAVYDPHTRKAVVVLSNTQPDLASSTSPSGGGTGAGDIARHLLRPSIPIDA